MRESGKQKIINASEIGNYLYCRRSWWYALVNPERESAIACGWQSCASEDWSPDSTSETDQARSTYIIDITHCCIGDLYLTGSSPLNQSCDMAVGCDWNCDPVADRFGNQNPPQ